MSKKVFIHFPHGFDSSLIYDLTSKVKLDYKFAYKYSADHITESDKDILSHGDAFALIAPDNKFKFVFTDLDKETRIALIHALLRGKDILLFYKNLSTGYTLYQTSISHNEINGISGTSDEVRAGYFKGKKHFPAGITDTSIEPEDFFDMGDRFIDVERNPGYIKKGIFTRTPIKTDNTILLRLKYRK